MPTVPTLTDGLSSVFGFEISKARSLSRYLKEAGLVTTGARGVNAPDATFLDAARLLIAMMLDSKLPTVAEDVRIVGSFAVINEQDLPSNFKPRTLEEGLATLIEYTGRVSAPETILFVLQPYAALARVEIKHPKRKKITINFSHPDLAGHNLDGDLPDAYMAAARRFPTGFYQQPMMTNRELSAVAALVLGHGK